MQNSSRRKRRQILHETQKRRWNQTNLPQKRRKTPEISIIAPCFNEARNLPLFLASLRKQTNRNYELIVVDGGSDDGSLELLMGNAHVIIDDTRNFGYLRNVGASVAKGSILFHTCVDTYMEPHLLEKINHAFENKETVAVSGRTFALGTSIFAHLGYQMFDFLRFLFTCLPIPIRKYRPSGNFLCIRKELFDEVGGYPEVSVNEDGLMGQKLDSYPNRKALVFNLNLYVGHTVKKFESMGGIRAILFYLYTLGNFAPMIQPLLEPIRKRASLVFEGRSRIESTRQLFMRFWNWL